ncbi:hypothetical protein L7F22_025349 [Adiantum nelumboides]|nr:hypothetical protein [Adiantum nelumboides]
MAGEKGGPPSAQDSLVEAAIKVLNTADPWLKASYGDTAAVLWKGGLISHAYTSNSVLHPPRRPARPDTVTLVSPQSMPKLGKGGSLQSRQALLHSLVHIESWAIDLSWDIIARFGEAAVMPKQFFDDFVKVAEDEARHFRLLAARLVELGSSYGALPAHDGLWESAEATSSDIAARLAIEHCVHEVSILGPVGVFTYSYRKVYVLHMLKQARGLDVLPTTISRFRKGGDNATADLLQSVVYPEEVSHCAAGIKWFTYVALRQVPVTSCLELVGNSYDNCEAEQVVGAFHTVVRTYFKGALKPPFNVEARNAAGFPVSWYLPLAIKE